MAFSACRCVCGAVGAVVVVGLAAFIILFGSADTVSRSDTPGVLQSWVDVTRRNLFGGEDHSVAMQRELDTLRRCGAMRGRNVLVTGGNRGLGRSIAVHLVSLGANVVVATRRVSDETIATSIVDDGRNMAVSDAEGTGFGAEDGRVGTVRLLQLDLGDLDSVDRAVTTVVEEWDLVLDAVVLNAAIVTSETSLTSQGFESMFGVNCLGHYSFVSQLVERGGVKKVPAGKTGSGTMGECATPSPRIVVVASESHRTAASLSDEAPVGRVVQFGMTGSMERYAHSKHCLITAMMGLARKLHPGAGSHCANGVTPPAASDLPTSPWLPVHSMCPGAVNTDIARDAPWWIAPLVRATMRLTFQTPQEAAVPVVYMVSGGSGEAGPAGAGPPVLSGRTGVYFHKSAETCSREDTYDTVAQDSLLGQLDSLAASRTPPTPEQSGDHAKQGEL